MSIRHGSFVCCLECKNIAVNIDGNSDAVFMDRLYLRGWMDDRSGAWYCPVHVASIPDFLRKVDRRVSGPE